MRKAAKFKPGQIVYVYKSISDVPLIYPFPVQIIAREKFQKTFTYDCSNGFYYTEDRLREPSKGEILKALEILHEVQIASDKPFGV